MNFSVILRFQAENVSVKSPVLGEEIQEVDMNIDLTERDKQYVGLVRVGICQILPENS